MNEALSSTEQVLKNAFYTDYKNLTLRMARLAERDGDVFIPNPEPVSKVDYIFVAMEPSLGGWAKSKEEALEKVNRGFRNFLDGYETMILHFCIRRYLLNLGESYYMTDLSKGAMLVERAGAERKERYNRWFGILQDEIELLSKPTTMIFAVGTKVGDYLERNGFDKPWKLLLHYSTNAASCRAMPGKEKEFEAFANQASHDDFLEVAQSVLKEANIPKEFIELAYNRMKRSSLTDSRKELMFNYKSEFDVK